MDVAAQNAVLDNSFGSASGVASPSTWELAFFAGDPTIDDSAVEFDGTSCPGYVRASFAESLFTAASGGVKTVSAPIQFDDATGEWSLTATHLGLIDGGDSTTIWKIIALPELLDVTAAGTGPAVVPSFGVSEATSIVP